MDQFLQELRAANRVIPQGHHVPSHAQGLPVVCVSALSGVPARARVIMHTVHRSSHLHITFTDSHASTVDANLVW